MVELYDALAWSRSLEEQAVEDATRLQDTTLIYTGWCMGDISTRGMHISEAGMHSDIAYLQGCLEAEIDHIDSLRSGIHTFRGRLVVMSNHAIRRSCWYLTTVSPSLRLMMRMNGYTSCVTSWTTWRRALSWWQIFSARMTSSGQNISGFRVESVTSNSTGSESANVVTILPRKCLLRGARSSKPGSRLLGVRDNHGRVATFCHENLSSYMPLLCRPCSCNLC